MEYTRCLVYSHLPGVVMFLKEYLPEKLSRSIFASLRGLKIFLRNVKITPKLFPIGNRQKCSWFCPECSKPKLSELIVLRFSTFDTISEECSNSLEWAIYHLFSFNYLPLLDIIDFMGFHQSSVWVLAWKCWRFHNVCVFVQIKTKLHHHFRLLILALIFKFRRTNPPLPPF